MTRGDEPVQTDHDAVFAEHRALREILKRLRTATERGDITSRLEEFRGAASNHFAAEEREGGFYESVVLAAPRHQSVLLDLQEEHAKFLREADELVERTRDCDDQDLGCVRESIAALADRLAEHEATENEILLEVMNTDLGAGD